VRGLNDPKKRVVLKNWLRKWKVDVVYLQETKLDKVDGRVIHSIWGNRFVGWKVLNAVNTAGGVLLLWDKRVVDRVDSKVGIFSMSCRVVGRVYSMVLNGLVRACMARIGMIPGLSFGMSCRKFGISGLSRGVFLVILMWLGFLANGGVMLELLLQWLNFLIL
jgi:hypothetical protein